MTLGAPSAVLVSSPEVKELPSRTLEEAFPLKCVQGLFSSDLIGLLHGEGGDLRGECCAWLN